MSLLGFLAAGAAQNYMNAKNAETDRLNQAQLALFSKEMDQAYQERLAETQAKHNMVRDEQKFRLKREDDELQHGRNVELQKVKTTGLLNLQKQRDDSAMARTRMTQEAANARTAQSSSARIKAAEISSKNRGSNGGDFSVKDLSKSIESDQKEIFNLKKELNNPINKINAGAEYKQSIMDRIDSLERRVADRTALLKQRGGGTTPALDLSGLDL